MTNHEDVLPRAYAHALAHLASLPERHVGPSAEVHELRAALGGELPAEGTAPERVIDELVDAVQGGLIASPGPRYFGFVVGGALPVAVGADWLTSAWDQMAGLYASAPAAAVAEEVVGEWLVGLLGLPPGTSVGFVTGAQMANATALAAARHAVLARVGWNVEADGLAGAPPIDVLVGEQVHITVLAALRWLGLGTARAVRVAADAEGRMRPDALAAALAAGDGPAIVCAQAGEVNTGACDPLDAIADLAAERGAWLHVDGAFGLWAAASPHLAHLVRGAERADSWATDAHKWLNVPYDSGLVFVADRRIHETAMSLTAAYLPPTPGAAPDPCARTPEASRRARGFPVYAALRALGREGVAAIVERCCALAGQMAVALDASSRLRVINEVVLNQVLVAIEGPEAERAAATDRVVARVQAEGTCWLGPTVYRGAPALRVSIANWSTTEGDVRRSAAAIVAAAEAG